jgi:tRNA (adenine57-N1/adenine58-N1)-methyltransferase catalytic subunit
MSSTFQYGERALLVDSKQRRYLVTLSEGGEFHSHAGFVPHSDLVGRVEGVRLRSTRGANYLAIRPTLEDFVVEMPRGAQVIYPKDLAPICMIGDIGPGTRVLESGVGSGALSMTMLRWGADIVGYELREDFAARARSNVSSFLGADAMSRYRVELRDCYEGIDERDLDRVVLDLPEPWRVIPHAEEALRPGGIVVAYTPSITQAASVRATMDERRGWMSARTLEVLHRTWYIAGAAVRPDHRMVAHTGFLTTARFIGGDQPDATTPRPSDVEPD